MKTLTEEEKVNERIRLMTLDELLACPNLPLEKYNQYATLKGEVLKKLNPNPVRSKSKGKLLPLLLVGLLAMSCIWVGSIASYIVSYNSTPHPHHYSYSVGTEINVPITGSVPSNSNGNSNSNG
jgi:hypothetical protein